MFGSYAKGTENEDSDIDIAIISSDFSDIIEDGAKLIGLTWKIDTRIEPHPITTEDFEKVSNPFVKELYNVEMGDIIEIPKNTEFVYIGKMKLLLIMSPAFQANNNIDGKNNDLYK